MSLNFSELGRQEREVRCIITQGLNKKIKVYYDDFEDVKKKFGLKIVTIYEPEKEQRTMILDLINKGIKEKAENSIAIKGDDFLLTLLEELTDIDLNLDSEKEEDREQIDYILKNPSKILLAVHNEVTEICNEIFDEIYNNLVSFAERPEGVREALLKEYSKEDVVNTVAPLKEEDLDVVNSEVVQEDDESIVDGWEE